MINSIQKNLPDTVIDKKILTLDEVHDFMRKNMIQKAKMPLQKPA